MDITEVITAPRSRWQNAYVESVIGSMRRGCLDHMVTFNARHLRRVLSSYIDHYHRTRTHLSLDKNCPDSRPIMPRSIDKVIALQRVGACITATNVSLPDSSLHCVINSSNPSDTPCRKIPVAPLADLNRRTTVFAISGCRLPQWAGKFASDLGRRSLSGSNGIFGSDSGLFWTVRHQQITHRNQYRLAILIQSCHPHLNQPKVRTRLRWPPLENFTLNVQLIAWSQDAASATHRSRPDDPACGPELALDQEAHGHRSSMPTARYQTVKYRVLR